MSAATPRHLRHHGGRLLAPPARYGTLVHGQRIFPGRRPAKLVLDCSDAARVWPPSSHCRLQLHRSVPVARRGTGMQQRRTWDHGAGRTRSNTAQQGVRAPCPVDQLSVSSHSRRATYPDRLIDEWRTPHVANCRKTVFDWYFFGVVVRFSASKALRIQTLSTYVWFAERVMRLSQWRREGGVPHVGHVTSPTQCSISVSRAPSHSRRNPWS